MNVVSKQIDENILISKIAAGDKSLFTELYNRYKKQLMLTCLRYIPERDLAENALQESFIAIYKDLGKYDSEKGKFITWATRVAVNICLKKFRKKSIFSKMAKDFFQ